MRSKRILSTAVALLTLFGGAAVAEEYDSEGGINWFGGNDGESAASVDGPGVDEGSADDTFGYDYDAVTEVGDDDFGTDDDWYDEDAGDVGYDPDYEHDDFGLDDYGLHDPRYNWETSDSWYDGWYGDSDAGF